MAVRIDYRLTGTGWADCDVTIGASSTAVEASYLGDALRELIEATLGAVGGSGYTVAHFWDEPGEYRFVLEPKGDLIRVRILEFPNLWSDEPDDVGDVKLDDTCSLQEFAEAVLGAALAVLKAHGVEGYKENWVSHEFPTEVVNDLKRALGGATLH
jgi:hypothetical protein